MNSFAMAGEEADIQKMYDRIQCFSMILTPLFIAKLCLRSGASPLAVQKLMARTYSGVGEYRP